jgi:hypothetical protein
MDSYAEASQGALAFELILGQLSLLLHSPAQRAAFGAVWSQRQLLVGISAGGRRTPSRKRCAGPFVVLRAASGSTDGGVACTACGCNIPSAHCLAWAADSA